MQLLRRWHAAPAAMLVAAALLSEGPTSSSAFFLTTPALSSLGIHQRYAPAGVSISVGNSGGEGSQRNRLHPAAGSRVKVRRETSTMLLGGAGGLVPAVGEMMSTVVDQAQAHVAGAGAGAILLSAEMPKPPNIYGPIAQGGVLIVLSGVFAAYMMVVIVTNMSPEDLIEVNKGLAGGDEVDELEEQRLSLRKRLKAITKDIEDGNDPTLGMGLTPTGERAEKIDKITERALQTDIASIEDEYDD